MEAELAYSKPDLQGSPRCLNIIRAGQLLAILDLNSPVA